MDNTQLPAEVLPKEWQEEIQKKADELYPLIGDVKKKIGYKAGAIEYSQFALHCIESEQKAKRITTLVLESRSSAMKEYAIKLHACDKTNSALEEKNRGLEEEIKRLNEWQERAKKLLNPIWDFADKNIDMVAGESKTAAVINYIHQARAILRKVMIRHESGLLPNRLLYNEIKTFLDGTKETPGTIPE